MFTVENIVRENIRNMLPYSSARDEFKGEASVFLDANENPYPSPYNRYPDPLQMRLKQSISELKKIPVEQIFLGNGSDECIDILIRLFCIPGQSDVVIPRPTYGMYEVSARINDVAIRTADWNENFDIDEANLFAAITRQTRLIFLCNPNNPTGNLLNRNAIQRICQNFSGLVVVDEAYIDFADSPGCLSLLPQTPNLVVFQTFSKAWGLAGIRLGMGFAAAEIIRYMNKIKPPYNISTVTQQIVLQKLQDTAAYERIVQLIKEEKKRLMQALSTLPVVQKIYPSDANFLLVKINRATETYRKLTRLGIIVRDRSQSVRCEDCLRITIGTQEENDKLLQALKKIYEEKENSFY